jgi:hypothetical protein
MVDDVRFEDAAGNPCRSSGSMGSGDARYTTMDYQVEADPKGMIVLTVYEEPRRRRVPISFSNVRLP